jgi:hypothetical protein
VIFGGRFSLQYKNLLSLLNIIKALPKGFELLIIGNKNIIDDTFFEQIHDES